MDKIELQKKIIGYYTEQKYRFSNVEEIHQDENWKSGVATLKNICDYFGYKTAGIGSVHLVLFIHSDPNRRNVLGDVLLLRDALWFNARILSNDRAVARMAEYVALPEIKVTGIV